MNFTNGKNKQKNINNVYNNIMKSTEKNLKHININDMRIINK